MLNILGDTNALVTEDISSEDAVLVEHVKDLPYREATDRLPERNELSLTEAALNQGVTALMTSCRAFLARGERKNVAATTPLEAEPPGIA